jgi:hypothetical protein
LEIDSHIDTKFTSESDRLFTEDSDSDTEFEFTKNPNIRVRVSDFGQKKEHTEANDKILSVLRRHNANKNLRTQKVCAKETNSLLNQI